MVVYRDLPRTLLPLDRWAEILGMDPRHFRQVTTAAKPQTNCNNVWKQYSWQESDQVGRYDVAQAIQQAEKLISQYVGYKLLPTWEVAERRNTPKPTNVELLRSHNVDARGYYLALLAKWGNFVEAGVEAKTLIVAGTAITYTDVDGDSYDETATISFATTVTDPEELAVYYPGESGADKWEIRPLNDITISGGVATITMWRHQLVDPDLIEALSPEAVAGETDSNFLTTVDVYRKYNDPSTQCTLIWDPNQFNCSACSNSTTNCCEVCGQTTQTGCLMPKDYEAGWLMYRAAEYEDGEWSSACMLCGRNPDQVQLYYRAGFQDLSLDRPKLQMAEQWERAVAYYALTLLDRDLCDCQPVRSLSSKWTQDLAAQTPAGSGVQINDEVLNNPLGTTRAAMYVWNMIREPGRRLALPVQY